MYKTIIRRLLILIPQLFVISVLMFLLAYNMPGDALTGLAEDPRIAPERIAEMREQLGLNDPWPQQYGRWIGGIILRGIILRDVKAIPYNMRASGADKIRPLKNPGKRCGNQAMTTRAAGTPRASMKAFAAASLTMTVRLTLESANMSSNHTTELKSALRRSRAVRLEQYPNM